MPDQNQNIQVENVIRAAVNIQIEPILRLLQADPHQWSSRPCSTCSAVSALAGHPFGCNAYPQRP